jgi:DNA-binding XRE family transcriptional regulator
MNGSTIKRAENGLTDLKTARNNAGLSQGDLATLVGTKRENISTWESGKQGMSRKTAARLSNHLDTSEGEILTANRLNEYQRAKIAGNAAGAILAIKGLIEGLGEADLTPEGEKFLDDLADDAIEFAGVGGKSEDREVYGEDPERDPLGHLVGVSKAASSREAGIWPSLSGGAPPDPEAEPYDPLGHDGRDVNGHRVAPLPDVYEDDYDDDEEA